MRDFPSEAGPASAVEAWKGVAREAPEKSQAYLPDGYRYFLPTGFRFGATLETAIFSYNTETPAVLAVERDVVYLGRVVLPAGTRVHGAVLVQKTNNRVNVNWHTLVFPEGDEVRFSGIALSVDGSAGLQGKVEEHKDSAVASTVLRATVAGAGSLAALSAGPIAGEAVRGATDEMSRGLSFERQKITTSITVEAEVPVSVYVTKRVYY